MRSARQRICFVVSSPLTIHAFLTSHIAALSADFDVSVAANVDPDSFALEGLNGRLFRVPIERRISPMRDLMALVLLVRLFRAHHYDLVHSVTPKAGLLAMAAAWLAQVPSRIHTFTGQIWATRKGPTRVLLRAIDRLIALFATHVLVDSRSQREFLIANRVVAASKSAVLAEGSICGVDGERFRPDGVARVRIRAALGVPDDAVLFLYLGRLIRDKGVLDLAEAFVRLARRNSSAYLFVAGPDEEGLRRQMQGLLAPCANRVRWSDYTDQPQECMAAADVFCLPSYREGFGQVAIEAAAVGLPVVASRIYGVVDAVADGETGLLYPPGEFESLHEHMETLLRQPELRRRLGIVGRARALRDFSAGQVTRSLLDYYAGITVKL